MSIGADAAFIASFDASVKHAYQDAGRMHGKIREKNNVVGSTHRFPKMNKGLAHRVVRFADAVPMNVGHSNVTAVLEDWETPELTDKLDQAKINWDERGELVKVVAHAMGRRNDQLILDAMIAGSHSTQVSVDLGGTNSGLNLKKILRAKRLLDDVGVPAEDRFLVHSAAALEQALQELEIGSSDFNVIQPLVSGQLSKFAGFTFVPINTRGEGGLPVNTNVRTNFAFHKDAVGLATGVSMRTEIDKLPGKSGIVWQIKGLFSAGAVVIDDEGVYDVLTFEA